MKRFIWILFIIGSISKLFADVSTGDVIEVTNCNGTARCRTGFYTISNGTQSYPSLATHSNGTSSIRRISATQIDFKDAGVINSVTPSAPSFYYQMKNLITFREPPRISTSTPQVAYTNQPFSLTGVSTDDPVTWSATSKPSWLTLSSSGVFSGTPTSTATHTFNITISKNSLSSTKSFTIEVKQGNNTPTIDINSNFTLLEGENKTITNGFLSSSDADNNTTLYYTLVTSPKSGILYKNGIALNTNDTFTQVNINANDINYTHSGDENISDSFVFNVKDQSNTTTNNATFNITITPVNDTPTINVNNPLTVVEGRGGLITNSYLSSSDVDNNTTLLYTIITAPTNGKLYKQTGAIELNATNSRTFTQAEINSHDINYTHNGTMTTSDYFEFNVSDQSSAYTTTARFNIVITEFNDPPTYDINMTDIIYLEDSSEFNLSLSNIIDQESADLNISIESNDTSLFTFTRQWGDSNLSSANYSGKDFNISFVPLANKYGKAELNITVWDGTNRVSKDFNITLTAVNDTPIINTNSTLSVNQRAGEKVSSSYLSSSDPDNNTTLYYTLITAPTKGNLYFESNSSTIAQNEIFTQALINANDINYTNSGTIGSDSFEFRVSDQSGAVTANTTFNITIVEVNLPPTYDLNMTDVNVSEDFNVFDINITYISDPENRDLNISVESNDTSLLSFALAKSTNVTYANYHNQDINLSIIPIANKYGKAELNVTVSDGVNKVSKDFNITIAPKEDNVTITQVSNINKDMNSSEFNISLNIINVDMGDVNLSVDINDSSLIEYNQTWYDSTNEYNLTYSEYYNKDINLSIKPKANQEGIVRFTIKLEDNVSGEVNSTFDLNISAYNLVLADLNAISLTSPTTTNLTFPTAGSINTSAISWFSNNTAVITNSGSVTQGESDISVTLTASATLAKTTLTKTFNVTVTGNPPVSSGGVYTPVTTTLEPTPEPTPDVVIIDDTIIVVDENPNGKNVNEEVVVITKIDTDTQVETYQEFSENGDGTNLATVELKSSNGEVIKTEIKTELSKESVTITSVNGGVETKANIDNEDGTKTETTSKVNTNGTIVNEIKVIDKDGNEVVTKVSSTKVGTNVEIAKDGSLTTTFKDNHGMEVKAVATAQGEVHHEVDTIDESGNVVKTIAKSNIKGSNVVIKGDGTVQTIAHTTATVTNSDGSESNVDVLVVVEGKSDGKATHLMQIKDESGNIVITKAESEIDGAETIITRNGVETIVKRDNNEFKVQAKPDGKALHQLKILDSNGEEVITEATSEVAGAKTIIKTDNTIETKATLIDNSGNENQVVAEAKSNGVAIHSLEVKDENGESVKVEATSELPNTKTVIKKDGVETTTKTRNANNQNVNIKVSADNKGLASHVVTVGENERAKVSGDISILSTHSTFVYSEVKGAKTNINKSGNVETIASKTKDDIITKAYVDTNSRGESTTYFKAYDTEGKEIETIQTFQKGQFELGNSATIKEENSQLKIDITSRVTKEIIF